MPYIEPTFADASRAAVDSAVIDQSELDAASNAMLNRMLDDKISRLVPLMTIEEKTAFIAERSATLAAIQSVEAL